ncbi:hypothetical protein FISHEDRAFT_36872 [Fistulina hepatica ATCC 64428]|uniref:F-box domain-containing protein n=1 Tax=Fistulina hepatica ATCC 64428 TaxID=1128425 RepID=A0A0D7AIK7_9AGAR|nr:hypothetical protein FISHEDRAFT_36872 [Fistulina hepatica ATCC 64428]
MASFTALPAEILPVIFGYVLKSQHLAWLCLVNHVFYDFAAPLLYDQIMIYSWHRDGKIRIIQLFCTLSRTPRLAKYVRRLVIRDFPKSASGEAAIAGDIFSFGLRNCVHLRACTWTRDGSLTSKILQALSALPFLEDLEINGHSDGNYRPQLLLSFTKLRRLSIIMPSASVAEQLVPWSHLTGSSLRDLTLICKSSTVINDRLLQTIAPSLIQLEQLHLTGCSRVTHAGVWALLEGNISGLKGLGLEGLSKSFNMSSFVRSCRAKNALSHLESITLTVQQHFELPVWTADVIDLLSASRLRAFQIYSTGAVFEAQTTDDFWGGIVATHGPRLTRFSVHRMIISLDAIDSICSQCPILEQLFIVVEPGNWARLSMSLSKAKRLRAIHMNYPLEAHLDEPPILSPDGALQIVSACSSTLTEFGCNTRVWQVIRPARTNKDSSAMPGTPLEALPVLTAYENPEVPEQFLVVRT